MIKKIIKSLCFLIAVLIFISCSPTKYSIKYDVSKEERTTTPISNLIIGVSLFEDRRPSVESKGKAGFSDTSVLSDEFFEKPIPFMVAATIRDHLSLSMNANVQVIEKEANTINIDFLTDQKNHNVDYILIGTIDHFTSAIYDEHHTARMTGTFLSVFIWPVMPMLLPVVIAAGSVENTVDMDFNNILLVKVDGPQIMWQGQCKTSTKETVSTVADSETLLRHYTENLKQNITCISDSISLSAQSGFPDKLTTVQTKLVFNRIISNKSLMNIKY